MKNIFITQIFIVLLLIAISCDTSSKVNKEKIGPNNNSFETYEKQIFGVLDSITQSQKNKLVEYLESIKVLAHDASQDQILLSFFRQQIAFQEIENEKLSEELINKSKSVESSLINHYIENYNQFFNILMIDKSGKIIYTIRKEADINQNIFNQKFSQSLLYKKLKKSTNESFVDFEFYEISNEPSAFFIEPIVENNKLSGWFVLQFSTTKINSIFDRSEKLGETGEVILVNKNHYMLTNSRFNAESTILKQKLAANNISEKFKLKEGHKTVTDYRGFKVISSFKVFSFWDSEWLIITKMNDGEILTNYFKSNKQDLFKCIENALNDRKYQFINNNPYKIENEVNIDEIKRIEGTETIHTKGLATCTGLLIYLPNQFAYLAHISPYDKIYNENRTDLIGHLMNHINYLEITKAEKQLLKIIIVAPDLTLAKNITNRLIKEGIFLNQIKLVTKGNYRSSEITYQCCKSDAIITLNIKDTAKYYSTKQIPDLASEICFVE